MKLPSFRAEATMKPLFALLVTIAISMIWAADVLAYEEYADGCDNCHNGFEDNPYVPPSGGTNWTNSLHEIHRNDMLGGDCDTCHTGDSDSRTPVFLESSNGGAGLAPIGCVGCHGRDQDAGNATTPNGTSQRGAGLRQHHEGFARCTGCHDDQTGYTPVGEDVLPNYYATPGTGHSIPTNPCNPSGGENYAGTALGLDNDGDGTYDTSDANCVIPVELMQFEIE